MRVIVGNHIVGVPSTKAFISYVREDKETILLIDQVLMKNDIEPITDYNNMYGGANWPRRVRQLIENSDYFIICFSTKSQ